MADEETTNTFSSTMRKLNKEEPEKVIDFIKAFKEAFDEAVDNGLENHQDVALLQAKIAAYKKENRFIKMAQLMMPTNNNPEEIGLLLAKMIKILIDKLPHNKQSALLNIRNKIYYLNPTEISLNKMPETAAYGQSITLIKTLLNGYNPTLIKQILSTTIRSL